MKKTVFISSTFLDLQEERQEIWKALKNFDVIVKGMEEFGARPEDSLTTCLNEVEQSDIYIGIIGVRFGSIDKLSHKSFTQLEYEKALEANKPILIYLIDLDNAKVTPSLVDIKNQEKLSIFKEKLKETHTVDYFKDSKDIVDKLNRQFKKFLAEKKDEFKDKDEYEQSLKIIKRFFLTPKDYSGREIKLKVKFVENPYPASQEVCSKFGMDYGKTIGSKIKIITPKLNEHLNNFSFVFIENKQIDSFLELDKGKEFIIYARVLFNDEKVSSLNTTFMDFKYEVLINMPDEYMMDTEPPDPYATYTKINKGEGQVILVLKEFK
jgi:hypothetical protein